MSRNNMLLNDHYEDYHASLKEFRNKLEELIYEAIHYGRKYPIGKDSVFAKNLVKENT